MQVSGLHNISLRGIDIPEKYRISVAVIISILFHVLALLLVNNADLTFKNPVIQNPVNVEKGKRLVFEIVESNPEAEVAQPPEDAELASDRNTQARDNTLDEAMKADRPHAEGIAEGSELPAPPGRSVETLLNRPTVPFKKFDAGKIGIEKIQEKQRQGETQQGRQFTQVMPNYRDFSANELGGFSLSTYEWNFAPYMLELKRKIQRHINPPTAFYMRLIEGKYIIQFVIERSGAVREIRVLASEGSKALEETSLNAIKFSHPFNPLPADFPDKELIVTGRFRFYIIK